MNYPENFEPNHPEVDEISLPPLVGRREDELLKAIKDLIEEEPDLKERIFNLLSEGEVSLSFEEILGLIGSLSSIAPKGLVKLTSIITDEDEDFVWDHLSLGEMVQIIKGVFEAEKEQFGEVFSSISEQIGLNAPDITEVEADEAP